MRIHEIKTPPPVAELIERFGARRDAFVLDSSQSNDGLGQWSFFGADPYLVLSGKDGIYTDSDSLDGPEQVDGLSLLSERLKSHKIENTTGIPFIGGAVGFLSYDYGRQLESVPVLAKDDRSIPDLHFGFYDGVAALNVETGVLYLVALGIRGDAAEVVQELVALVEGERLGTGGTRVSCGDWEWNLSESEFLQAVESVRAYIASGDVYQVNLSQRARATYEGAPLALFQALRKGNPSPDGAYLDFGGWQLMSTSPEQFLSKRGQLLETRPIKGTRPRTGDLKQDALATKELQNSLKDRAELLMIVDLERNDLGRVAKYGTVRVEGLYQLENYTRVMHQTARVRAELRDGLDIFDCLRATFPGGSITGAPKVRAMEIIEELEPTRRGAYCGSVGYIGFDGDAEFNIAIRSLHFKDGYLDYQVGAGIVWDSDAASEFQETLDKGRAIKDAITTLL